MQECRECAFIKVYRNLLVLLFVLPGSIFVACAQNVPFDFNSPDKRMELDSQLREISGISMYKNDTTLIAIQDEMGSVFVLGSANGKILNQASFTGKGDFEDIQYAPPYIFANKSDGTIFQIDATSFKTVKTIDTGLEKINDVEGMFYSSDNNSLLLACKGTKDDQASSANERLVYRYDLKSNKLEKEPVFNLTKEKFIKFLESKQDTRDYIDLKANYNANVPEFMFGPSAIAKDPLSDNYYILSSAGKVLLIVNKTGDIVEIVKLHKKIYLQPEGLCFDSKGNLYISSEGKKKVATISFHKRMK